jgi:anti-anti-sigma regulatory factor
MSTEKTQLPDFVIANLYTDLLVLGSDIVIQPKTPAVPVETVFKTPEIKVPVAEPKNTKPVAPKQVPADIKENMQQWYLGNNGKKVVILIKEAEVAFINDQHLQFLSNILNACKLNLGDIALVNHINNPLVYADLKQKLQPKFIIAFDLQPKEIQLPFTIPNYQVQLHDNCKFLFASTLKMMEGDSKEAKLEKSKLWMSLKNMFQL